MNAGGGEGVCYRNDDRDLCSLEDPKTHLRTEQMRPQMKGNCSRQVDVCLGGKERRSDVEGLIYPFAWLMSATLLA